MPRKIIVNISLPYYEYFVDVHKTQLPSPPKFEVIGTECVSIDKTENDYGIN